MKAYEAVMQLNPHTEEQLRRAAYENGAATKRANAAMESLKTAEEAAIAAKEAVANAAKELKEAEEKILAMVVDE